MLILLLMIMVIIIVITPIYVEAAQGQASICGGLLLDARLRSWSRSGSGAHLRWSALGR